MSDFKKRLITQLVIVGVLVAVFAGFFVLLQLNIEHEVSLITDAKGQKAFVSQSSENLAQLIKEWAVAGPYLSQIQSLVPTKDDLVAFQKNLTAMAQQNQVGFSFTFGSDTGITTGELGSITFTAVADGTRNSVLGFIRAVEARYYALKINSLDISGSPGSARLSIAGQVFYAGSQ